MFFSKQTLMLHVKRSSLVTMLQNKNDIMKVLKLAPVTIFYNNIIPWWSVRNVVVPVVIVFTPHFLLVMSIDFILTYLKNYDILIGIIFCNLSFLIIAVQCVLIDRYLNWTIDEANSVKIVEEELKLD